MTRPGATGVKVLFPLLFLIFFCTVSQSQASIEYRVKKGDTLSGIARKHRVSVKSIQNENGISSVSLKPGMKISIPSKRRVARKREKHSQHEEEITSAAQPSSPDNNSDVKPATQLTADLYHTVRKGETLFSIARKYSVDVAEIKELNGLNSSRLKRGQKLLVKKTGPKTYIVKKGDTIGKIAKRFDMDVDELMKLNEMGSPSVKAGQKLYLEEKVDTATAEAYDQIPAKKIEEEITKSVSQSEEVKKEDTPGKLITFAKKLINIPYKFGGNSILGIDCSAYVRTVYGFLGIELPRTAREQFKTGETIERDDLSIGDLVFFRTYASFPSHVGIYLGNNLFIHASSRGKKVTIDSLDTPYYLKRFIGGKRLLTEGELEKDQQG